MSRAMPKKLRQEILDVLGELIDYGPHDPNELPTYRGRLILDGNERTGEEGLTELAILHLEDLGAIRDHEFGGGTTQLRATAYGREYWEKLTAPEKDWFRSNWFAAIVAAATIAASIGAIVVNVLD